jgi:uncharacterized protein
MTQPFPDSPNDAEAVTPVDTSSSPATGDAMPPAAAEWDGPRGWQRLPKRAYRVFLYVALLVAAVPATVATLILVEALARRDWGWMAIAMMWIVALAFALWIADKRYRYTFWILDEDGFAVRRGRLWQWETRVPSSRVQHLDLKRGPLERAHSLATLVLHTAGTRLNAVSISGLDDADAERLRDHFSRQIDRQADDDHA